MRDRLIVIHFGAHRTGTTYLQAVFSRNAAFLAEHGIQYRCLFGVAPVREALIASRRAAADGDTAEFDRQFAAVEDYLTRLRGDTSNDDLLISYEGILGGLPTIAEGHFYRHHQLCLDKFLKIFEGERVHGLFAIREYAALLESCYAKLVESGFEVALKRAPAPAGAAEVSWLPVVRALNSAFGPRFSLFTYEDFATSERRLLNWIFERTFKLDAALLALPGKRVNPSPSGIALGAMRLVNELVPLGFGRELRNRINRRLSAAFSAAKYARPRLLSESAKRALRQRYDADLRTLRHEVAGMYDPVLQRVPASFERGIRGHSADT